jgi:DNA-binding transcriptional LysR family regulator
MRVFLQVAYARSFNKAGKQLGTSHATVARAVRRLEARLRTQLLLAGARGIVLTPSGLRLAEGLAKIDLAISDIIRRIAPPGEGDDQKKQTRSAIAGGPHASTSTQIHGHSCRSCGASS